MKTLILIFATSILLIGAANAVENSNKKTRLVAFTWADKNRASNRTKVEYMAYVFYKKKPTNMEKFAYAGVPVSVIDASITSGASQCENAIVARLNQINSANEFYLTKKNNEIIDLVKALEIMEDLSFESELSTDVTYSMDGMKIDAMTAKPVGVSRVIRKRHQLIDGPEKGLFIKLPDGSDELLVSLFCFNINASPLKKAEKAVAAPMPDFISSEEVPEVPVEEKKVVYKPRREFSELPPVATAPTKAGCWDLNSNGVGDLSEDKNHDGVCDNNDCDVENRDDRKVVKTEGGNITITIYNDRNGNSQPAAPVQPVAPQQNMGGGFWNNPYALGWGNLAVNTGFGIWDRITSYFNQNQNYCGMQGNPWRGDYPVDRPIDRTPVGYGGDGVGFGGGGNGGFGGSGGGTIIDRTNVGNGSDNGGFGAR